MQKNRINIPINVTVPPDLLAELDAWRAEQVVEPPRSAVIVAALRAFISPPKRQR